MDFVLKVTRDSTDMETFRAETVKRLRELADQFEKSEQTNPFMYMVHNDDDFFKKRRDAERAKRLLQHSCYGMGRTGHGGSIEYVKFIFEDCPSDDISWLVDLLQEKAKEDE